MKIETGVMIVKGDKGWGVICSDGHSTTDGWVNLADATIYNPEFCTTPESATYQGSHYVEDLRSGKLVNVERITTVKILP